MLAFEMPPNEIIAINYFGLARQTDHAEVQKDFLRQALGAIAPNADFADSGDESELSKSFGIFLRCLQCAMQPKNPPVAITSVEPVRALGAAPQTTSRYMVRIATQKGSHQLWNIEVGQRKVSWYATLKKDSLTNSTRVNVKNFEIKSCFSGINCPRTALFETTASCLHDLQKHMGKRVNVAASEKFRNTKNDIFADSIVYENDVRSQSFVRANYFSKSSSLSIRMHVKALRNGSFGDIIPVEMKSTTGTTRSIRQIDARITGEGEVEIVR